VPTEIELHRNVMNFEEYSDAVATHDGRTTPSGRDVSTWNVDSLSLGSATVQYFQEGAPNIYEGVSTGDQIGFYVGLPCSTPIRANGVSVNDRHIFITRPGEEVSTFNQHICRFIGFSIPVDQFVHVSSKFDPVAADRFISGSIDLETEPSDWASIAGALLRLKGAAHSGSLLNHEVARCAAIEDLIKVFANAASNSEARSAPRGRPKRPRRAILSRLAEVTRSARYFNYSIVELADYVGLPERTFRRVFLELYGITPKRYIALRQLCDIHVSLRNSSPAERVSEIAASHGIWDWGRMARSYQAIYGELPSDTLSRTDRH
jgi:AraC-like DNA-binding protein